MHSRLANRGLSESLFNALRVVEERLVDSETFMADARGVLIAAADRAQFTTGDLHPAEITV